MALDEAGRTGALQARPQGLVAVGQRGRHQGGLGGARPGRRSHLRVDLELLLGHGGAQPVDARPERRNLLAQGRELGLDGLLREHGLELLLLELGAPLGQVAHLFVHGLQVAARRARRRVHALLDAVPPFGDAGDLLLERLLSGAQLGPASVRIGPLRLEHAELGLQPAQAGRLGQRVAPVLQLGQRRVEVLDGEQVLQGVGHVSSSAAARASGRASTSAASASTIASSQLNQRASGLSPGGGCGSSSAPSRR